MEGECSLKFRPIHFIEQHCEKISCEKCPYFVKKKNE